MEGKVIVLNLRRLAAALLLGLPAVLWAAPVAPAAPAPQLLRYPYLTDATDGGATVTWATDTSVGGGSVAWGVAGSGSCATGSASAGSPMPFSVSNTPERQWSVRLAPLPADTTICYRVFGDGADLLGSDPTPQFTTQLAPGASGPLTFAVVGDWGLGTLGGNPGQEGVMRQLAGSGARFALTSGDIAYDGGTEDNYGDLVHTGNSVSGVFGPLYWTLPGRSIPMFPANGNHGLRQELLDTWPTAQTKTASGGVYGMLDYPSVNGSIPGSYPSAWYAFDEGTTRIYVLDASWPDGNVGTASAYEDDADAHWTPSSAEYRWLQSDLAAHPDELKIAVFHYPLEADTYPNEHSDTFLQGADSLQGLLDRFGVALVFNGHAHDYERNEPDSAGLVSYVTGGGGATLEPVSHCTSSFDAYAVGWSSSGGSACGAASTPTSSAQVYHFLLVTVHGSRVTVTPTDSTGRTFDVQTYTFGAAPPPPDDTTPPSVPADVTATAAGPTAVDVSWGASSDDVGVTGYDVLRDGTRIATVTDGGTSYRDTGLSAGTTYTYAVRAVDAAGNASDAGTAAPVTTPSPPPTGTPPVEPPGTAPPVSPPVEPPVSPPVELPGTPPPVSPPPFHGRSESPPPAPPALSLRRLRVAGRRLVFHLSQQATVRIAIAHRERHHHHRRYVVVDTLKRRALPAGRETVAFGGRHGRSALATGRYRATVMATSITTGQRTGPHRVAFVVAPPGR